MRSSEYEREISWGDVSRRRDISTLLTIDNAHEITLLSTGALSYRVDGAVLASGTDAAHVALSKDVVVSQGLSEGNAQAVSTWDAVWIRPFDGVDPTVTLAPIS